MNINKKYLVVYLCVDETGKQSIDTATFTIKGKLTENNVYELQEDYGKKYNKKALLINLIRLSTRF